MTGVEKLAKMCSIVQEIDRTEEAKAAANKHYNDELKELWAKLKSVANEDTRQAEMEFKSTADSADPVVDVKPEAGGGVVSCLLRDRRVRGGE
ncbi:MAG TPA: hypothetical protein PLI86_00255 [bacterium]|nr:hypothetical protein [bacterium]